VAFAVGLRAGLAGAGPAQAILSGAGATATMMAIFFAAASPQLPGRRALG
jgi:hypothetical protein